MLVHGAWSDGSSWRKVIPLLRDAGHTVVAVQLPLTSLADDVGNVSGLVYIASSPLEEGESVGDIQGRFLSWKQKPRWYQVSTDDAVAPDAQRFMAERCGAKTVGIAASHIPMAAHPQEIDDLILAAALIA